MKKRLISILLVVLLTAALFAGTGISAHADTVSYSTMTYRMASGDYVLRICQKLGLNYYVCKPAIMKLNNISENQWRYLPVGKLLILPATDADAVVITTGKGSTVSASTTTTTTSSTTSSVIAAATPSSSVKTVNTDQIWFWLVPYELRSGETLTDAMSSLGMSFARYAGTIQKVNQIKNWGSARTETSILLPTVYPPASGYSRVTVYAHVMRAGETPYSVVTARGLNYTAIKGMLEILNEQYGSLANITTGNRFFYPIASDGKIMGRDRTAGTYGLYNGLNSADGTVEFYVNNERVYEAKAGQTVSYILKPAKGKAVKSVTLKLANGQGDMYLTGSSFVMPSCDVRLEAGFTSGHKITLECNYQNKAAVRVDGVSVDNAAKGAIVMVSSLDSSLAIDELYINYVTLTGAKREAVPNIDQGFVMPDYDVTVEVVLKAVPTYSFFIINDALNNNGANGTYWMQVDGARVTRAARGAEVKIVAEPDTGYTVGQIWVVRHDNQNPIGVFNNSFVMPNTDVDIRVLFNPKGNNIRINPVEGGQFWATVGAQDVKANAVSEAGTNVQVFLNFQADPNTPGYTMSTNPDDYVVTRTIDGLRIPVTVTGGVPSFRMPAGGATVTGGVTAAAQTYTARIYLDGTLIPAGQYRDLSLYTKGDNAAARSEFRDGSGIEITTQQPTVASSVGEYINLSYEGGEHIVLARYEIWDAAESTKLGEETNAANLTNCFQMPSQGVVIRAYFTSFTVKLAAKDVKVFGSGTVGLMVQDPNNPGNWISADGVKVGEPFAITVSPSAGYFFNTNPADGIERLLALRKDNLGDILLDTTITPNPAQGADGEWIFYFASMPDCGGYFEVTFDKAAYWVQLNTVDELGNPLTGGGAWKVTVNKKDTLVENSVTNIYVDFNDSITMALTEAGQSKYTWVRAIVNNINTQNKTFPMNGELAAAAQKLNDNGQPFVITAVLKDKALSVKKNPIKLNASFNNAARGTAGFLITRASDEYLRPIDPTTFVTECYAGDTVAIIPQAVMPNQYMTDRDHIAINLGSGNYITPDGPVDANGDGKAEEYTFVMPASGYKQIKIDFVPVNYNLTVNTDPASAPLGLFRVTYTDGSNSDVLLDTSFKQAPYGSVVRITLTEAGKKAGVKILAAGSMASITPAPAAKDMKAITNGFQFVMPADNTSVTVFLDGTVIPPDPTPVQLPAATSDSSLNLQYSYTDGSLITDGKPNSGETVKVDVTTALAAGEVIKGDIVFKDSAGNIIASVQPGGTFTVPYTENLPVEACAEVVLKQYKVRISVKNAPAEYTLDVDGLVVTDGQILTPNKEYGSSMTITVTGARQIDSVDNLNVSSTLPAMSATGTLEPAASVEDGATVDVIVNFKVKQFALVGTEVQFFETPDCSGTPITQAADGATVYVKGNPSDTSKYAKTIKVTDASGDQIVNDGAAFVVTSDVSAAVINETGDKAVTVQISYVGKPADADIVVKYDGAVQPSIDTVANVGSKDLDIVLNLPADYKFTNAGGDTAKYDITALPAAAPTVTIKMDQVSNGDTVNVSLEFLTPTRTLPTADKNGKAIEFYTSSAMSADSKVTAVPDGTAVYVKATVADTQYVTGVTYKGAALAAQSSGAFGPMTVKANVDAADVEVKAEDKTITLKFDYKDGAKDKLELYVGTNKQAAKDSIQVTDSGSVKLSDINLKTNSGYKFGTVKGTNVTVTKNGDTEVKFSVDFSKLANGSSVTIEVNVE